MTGIKASTWLCFVNRACTASGSPKRHAGRWRTSMLRPRNHEKATRRKQKPIQISWESGQTTCEIGITPAELDPRRGGLKHHRLCRGFGLWSENVSRFRPGSTWAPFAKILRFEILLELIKFEKLSPTVTLSVTCLVSASFVARPAKSRIVICTAAVSCWHV